MESNGIEIERERPRNRWTDEVLKDIRVLGVENWIKVAMDRSSAEVENPQRVVGRKKKKKRRRGEEETEN